LKHNRKQILLVHHDLSVTGGATAVAAWIVQALKDDFDLTILTWKSIDFGALNRFQGTALRDSEITILKPNAIVRAVLNLDRDYGSIQPVAYLMRMTHAIRKNYDLVIASGTEEMDLGGTGLVYVHFPDLARFWSRYHDCEGLPLWSKLLAIAKGKTRPWMIMAGYSVRRLKEATLLVNSDWTGDIVRRFYKLSATTLYPPATAGSNCREWDKRENEFLCIGRFTPAKRMDAVISILGYVREQQPDLKLHLVGLRAEQPDCRDYDRKLHELVHMNREWVSLHENVTRAELFELMGRMRYGIHANRDEHFGIAPDEMMVSGCIVFVHNSGGQVEIVDRDPRLCYDTDTEAVTKIARVAGSPVLQASILDSLATRQRMFRPEEFMRRLRAIVDRMIASASRPTHPKPGEAVQEIGDMSAS
jgi:glycosyltransferase involved in cell wall biosynthesis